MPIRIKINPDTVWGNFHHPVEHRLIVAGDEFEVTEISPHGTAHYIGSNGNPVNIYAENYTRLPDESPTTCTCDTFTVLMAKGCQCGAFQAERQGEVSF
jgi:hypothetical protein